MSTAAVSERSVEIVEASGLTGSVHSFEAKAGPCHLPRSRDTVIGWVASHAIALLKGEQWQGYAGHSIIHRFPALPTESAPRVLLALDAVWD